MPDVEQVDDLYGVDPAEFVAARDALARRLRAAGDTSTAAEVKALRRPPKTAWALNALARSEPGLIEAVITSASALALAFDGGGDLRTAQSTYRDAIHDAVTAAADRGGIDAEALRTRMRDTLFAAGADSEVAEALVAGTLRDDHEAPGFGIGPGTAAAAPRSASRSTHPSGQAGASPEPERRDRQPSTKDKAGPTAAERLAAPARGTGKRAGKPAAARPADTAEVAESADVGSAEVEDATPQRSELERRADLRRQRELDKEADRLRRKADRLRRDAEEAEARAAEARRDADAAEEAAAAKEAEADTFRDKRA